MVANTYYSGIKADSACSLVALDIGSNNIESSAMSILDNIAELIYDRKNSLKGNGSNTLINVKPKSRSLQVTNLPIQKNSTNILHIDSGYITSNHHIMVNNNENDKNKNNHV